MHDRFRFSCALVLGVLVAGAACAEPIEASRGQWSGAVAERSANAPGQGRVALRVEGTAERFKLELANAGGPVFAGEFVRGERKDVYGPPAAKGLMSMLGRGSTVNPVDGKPLAWARRTGDELVVYLLDLRNGAHRLDRMAIVPADGRVRIAFERREHDRPVERFTATLERAKP
jgi:hypothetical protein